MFLPFLIVAVIIIGTSGSKSSTKVLSATSKGIIFNCSYIEITDINKFQNGIIKEIEKYFELNNINAISQLDILSILSYLIKIYNPSCYKKIMERRLTSREKIVISIFITEIFKILEFRLFGIKININDPYYKEFNYKIDASYPGIREWLQIGQEFENIESINESFMKNLKYPV